MAKTGFIGYGNMGSIILRALLDAKAIPGNRVIVTNRTPEKLKDFTLKYPEVEIAGTISELAAKSERVFICTSTGVVKEVLNKIKDILPENAHVITITGNIEIKSIEGIFTGKISKIMPTQIAAVGEGVTLVCHNRKVLPQDREFIRKAFQKIGEVREITEKQFGLGAELTSCAPAFFAAVCRNFVAAAALHKSFTPAEINEMTVLTLYGTAKLFKEHPISFEKLIEKVATKGGISEEGVKILDRELPGIFEELFQVTMTKREKIKQQIHKQFGMGG
jgi:pyrroline-5-carboxylate reductase